MHTTINKKALPKLYIITLKICMLALMDIQMHKPFTQLLLKANLHITVGRD